MWQNWDYWVDEKMGEREGAKDLATWERSKKRVKFGSHSKLYVSNG